MPNRDRLHIFENSVSSLSLCHPFGETRKSEAVCTGLSSSVTFLMHSRHSRAPYAVTNAASVRQIRHQFGEDPPSPQPWLPFLFPSLKINNATQCFCIPWEGCSEISLPEVYSYYILSTSAKRFTSTSHLILLKWLSKSFQDSSYQSTAGNME